MSMKSSKDYSYNERLFSGGLRGFIHTARYKWLKYSILRYNISTDTVLELGCYDGKAIDYIPNKPTKYVGIDANWENGLQIAKEKWKLNPEYLFVQANKPSEIKLDDADLFDLFICMETLEHIPDTMLEEYIKKMASHTKGYALITIPNEKGLFLLIKWTIKRLLSKDHDKYSMKELYYCITGRSRLIKRNEHKGFDYDVIINLMSKYFDVIEISGHPFKLLTHRLCFGIGIVAKSK